MNFVKTDIDNTAIVEPGFFCNKLVYRKIKELRLVNVQIKFKTYVNDNFEALKKVRNERHDRKITKQLNIHSVWLANNIKRLNLLYRNKGVA